MVPPQGVCSYKACWTAQIAHNITHVVVFNFTMCMTIILYFGMCLRSNMYCFLIVLRSVSCGGQSTTFDDLSTNAFVHISSDVNKFVLSQTVYNYLALQVKAIV